MLKSRTEYTPGQMIRFEAAALYHSAATLREIMLQNQPELDFLDMPATAGMNSIRRGPRGEPNSINRNQEHYNGLIRALEKARGGDRRTAHLERLPAGMAATEPVPLPLHDDPGHDGTERPSGRPPGPSEPPKPRKSGNPRSQPAKLDSPQG